VGPQGEWLICSPFLFYLVMVAYCYILFSPSLQKFYTGATTNPPEKRKNMHLEGFYSSAKYTAQVKDWEIYLTITCENYTQALAIEKHIKRMKSSKYIQNLKKYPQIIEKLLDKYSHGSSQ